jgi:hypothetical protein
MKDAVSGFIPAECMHSVKSVRLVFLEYQPPIFVVSLKCSENFERLRRGNFTILVSILTLLDVILEYCLIIILHLFNLCFNPYSVGCYSGSLIHFLVRFSNSRFNPYSVGCYSGRGYALGEMIGQTLFQSLFCWMLFWKLILAQIHA